MDWEKLGIDVTVLPQLPQVGEQMIPIMSRFDVIVVNTLVCVDVIPLCVAADTECFWWVHEHENYFEYYKDHLPKEGQLGRKIHVLGVSPVTQKLLRDRAGYRKAGLLPFAVPAAFEKTEGVQKKKDGKLHFLCVALYAFVKGQDLLCAAIDQLPEELRQKCVFSFYGDLSEVDPAIYGPVARAAELYEEVKICDAVPHEEMLERIAEADWLIIPSRKEPMPTVAVEAMMLKTPCIISDICGVTEYLTDGKDAVFFRAGNAEALAEKIKSVSGFSEAEYLGLAGAAGLVYKTEFSEEVFERNIRKLLEG